MRKAGGKKKKDKKNRRKLEKGQEYIYKEREENE